MRRLWAILTRKNQFNHWHKLAGSGWLVASYYGSPKRNRAMLTGSDLLAKVSELQAQNATRTDIVLACGYIKPNGKASYVDFYESLLAAKYPNGLPKAEWEDVETELEFDDEEQEEKFQELCEDYPQKAVEVYYENIGNFDDFEEAYMGEYDSEAHFTKEDIANFLDTEIPSWIVINYQATWDTVLCYDYWEEDNFFFRNMNM